MKDSQQGLSQTRGIRYGALGLGMVVVAVVGGVLRSAWVVSQGWEMASLVGPLEGVVLGVIMCSAALVLSTVGLLRNERPRWHGVLGFALSVVPGVIGFFLGLVMLVRFIAQIGE